MTWLELDERIGYILEDMDHYGYQDMKEEGQLEEELYQCMAIDQIIEVLEQYDVPTDGFGRVTDYHAEVLENQMLIKELQAVV